MSDYKLYCFGESGNSFKVALMLELCGVKWTPELVYFFDGESRTQKFRQNMNELGEAPVLTHGDKRFSQSGVMLEYLSKQTGKFGGANEAEDYEILRWILFDNHKFTSYLATRRFLLEFMKTGETEVTKFFKERITATFDIVEKHLADREFIATPNLSIADLSMCGYIYYGDELRLDLDKYPNITAWKDRIAATDGWKHPYDLMPRAISKS